MPNPRTAAEWAQDIRLTDDGMLVLWGIIATRAFPTDAFGRQVVAAFREHFKNALDAYARQQVKAFQAVVRAALVWSESSHISSDPKRHLILEDSCDACRAEMLLCDALADYRVVAARREGRG